MAARSAEPGSDRPLRADARRNRARVLEVAAEVFAAEGLSVPVSEIARRVGVGTGTVSRHFPTKEDLFAAILLVRMKGLASEADALAERADPGPAFFAFFAAVVREGAANRGLSEALRGAGCDLEATAARDGYSVSERLGNLLGRAQQAGAVRSDVDSADVKALMVGCLARADDDPDGSALHRIVDVACEGLRTRA